MTESASKTRSVIAAGVDKRCDLRFQMRCEAVEPPGGFFYLFFYPCRLWYLCLLLVGSSAVPWGLLALGFSPWLGNQWIQTFPYCLKAKKNKLTLCLVYSWLSVCGTCHEGCASSGGRRGCVSCQTLYQPVKQMNCSVFISVY